MSGRTRGYLIGAFKLRLFMIPTLRGPILTLAVVLLAANTQLLAQERVCANGTRSQLGVCPEDGGRGRVPDAKPRLKLPPCPDNQWFREWHMCHVREDLGAGVVIDADFMNGTVYDPSAPAVRPGAYTFVDQFGDDLMDQGPLRLAGARVFVNFAELVKSGNARKFKVLVSFDTKSPYMLSKRLGVGSIAVPLEVQCRARSFNIDGPVMGYLEAQGNGYPLLISDAKTGANDAVTEADIQKAAREVGGSALQGARVVSNVLNSVCNP